MRFVHEISHLLGKIVEHLMKGYIDRKAEEKLKSLAVEKYIEDNMFISTVDGLELQMRGKHIVKLFAASMWEIVKDADNYVSIDITCEGYEPMIVIIQKANKLSPHKKAMKLEKENQDLKDALEELKAKCK